MLPLTRRKRGVLAETKTKALPAFPFAVTVVTGKTFRRRRVTNITAQATARGAAVTRVRAVATVINR